MIVNGFCKAVFRELPMEFAVEAQKLLASASKAAWADRDAAPSKKASHAQIRDLHARIGSPESSRASIWSSCAARSTRSWDRTARARAPSPACSPGARATVTDGQVGYLGQDLLAMPPEERAREGVFLAFQYPVEIPGVNNVYFLKAALTPSASTAASRARRDGFLRLVREKMKSSRWTRAANRGRSTWASPAARRSATRSCRWRCSSRGSRSSTRRTRASTSTRCASWPRRERAPRPDRAIVVVTHYQRLLDYIVPDLVHVLSDGRIGTGGTAGAGTRERGYDWVRQRGRARMSAAVAERCPRPATRAAFTRAEPRAAQTGPARCARRRALRRAAASRPTRDEAGSTPACALRVPRFGLARARPAPTAAGGARTPNGRHSACCSSMAAVAERSRLPAAASGSAARRRPSARRPAEPTGRVAGRRRHGPFAALNTALFADAAVVHIAACRRRADPRRARLAAGPRRRISHPRILDRRRHAAPHASNLHHVGDGAAEYFVNAFVEVEAATGLEAAPLPAAGRWRAAFQSSGSRHGRRQRAGSRRTTPSSVRR